MTFLSIITSNKDKVFLMDQTIAVWKDSKVTIKWLSREGLLKVELSTQMMKIKIVNLSHPKIR